MKTKHNLSPTQHETLVLNFTTISVMYPLDNDKMEIIMKDLEAGKGSELLDERWVYDHPGIPFASSGRQTAVVEQYGDAVLMKELDAHPNADLAAAGWKFYNAWEFHSVGNSGDMWNNGNSFGNKVPLFLAARNTVIVQNHAACINEQFSKITDDGYLRMIEMKVPSNATAPASGQRDYGTAAFYGCGTGSPWKSNSQLISEGCRMEIRARLRGQKNGFNMGIWLVSDESAGQKSYSEIDILENPVGPVTGDRAHQTFHTGPTTTDNKTKTANNTINMTEWNIYWVEWRSDTEVAIGINGEETVTLKKNVPKRSGPLRMQRMRRDLSSSSLWVHLINGDLAVEQKQAEYGLLMPAGIPDSQVTIIMSEIRKTTLSLVWRLIGFVHTSIKLR